MDNSPGWTNEQIDILTDKWSTRSATEIGAMINKTRNAVIGKAARLGLPHKKKTGGSMRVLLPKKDRPARRSKVRLQVEAIPVPVPVDGGVHILDLVGHHCRAVIGRGSDGLARYCGAHKSKPHPYCAGHAALYYNKEFTQ